jgi:Na+/phosphate symporter
MKRGGTAWPEQKSTSQRIANLDDVATEPERYQISRAEAVVAEVGSAVVQALEELNRSIDRMRMDVSDELIKLRGAIRDRSLG